MTEVGVRRYGALVGIPGARAAGLLDPRVDADRHVRPGRSCCSRYDTSGSFAEAGRVVGAFSLANAFGALVAGAADGPSRADAGAAGRRRRAPAGADRAGGRRPARARRRGCSRCSRCAAAATFPQLPAAMRSLWNALVDDPEQRATAYALVAVVFEVAVVTAPALVAGIVAVASPGGGRDRGRRRSAPVSALAFTMTPASRRWRGDASRRRLARAARRARDADGVRRARSCSARRSGSCRSRCRRSPPSAGRPRPAACCWPRSRWAASRAAWSTARARGPGARRRACPC